MADKREALKNELSELTERGQQILEAEEDARVTEWERERRHFRYEHANEVDPDGGELSPRHENSS